ncbi:MAG TPA: TadE/TadG family type IV pilus assembly protein [Bryobacteraceae bacterium]|nr:TadE/TadG family type IV pilus assembly protein [Bryobacteraceae bacterium]
MFKQRAITGARKRRQGGNQLVEVSLIFLPLCALLFGLFDFSVAIFMRATMQNAVREGVRYAVTYQRIGTMCQDASIKQIVKNSAGGFLSAAEHDSKIKIRYYKPTNLTVEVTGTNSNIPGNVVEVGVEGYSWSWIAPLWRSASPFVINVYAADRMEGLSDAASPPCR